MQEHTAPVFVVATANEVANLPPEFLRKGRFDEVWFVDLPVASERKQILTASLVAHNRNEKIKLDRVVAMTDGFSGAELAALVVDALYLAWGNKNKKITAKHLEDASVPVVPLSKMAAEKIGELRAWAKGRARPASKAETIAGPVGGPELDL
jgi:SpoVK/Ycf46/Vps4 family AAA+-type ATPase